MPELKMNEITANDSEILEQVDKNPHQHQYSPNSRRILWFVAGFVIHRIILFLPPTPSPLPPILRLQRDERGSSAFPSQRGYKDSEGRHKEKNGVPDELKDLTTSMWCSPGLENKKCKFNNICFRLTSTIDKNVSRAASQSPIGTDETTHQWIAFTSGSSSINSGDISHLRGLPNTNSSHLTILSWNTSLISLLDIKLIRNPVYLLERRLTPVLGQRRAISEQLLALFFAFQEMCVGDVLACTRKFFLVYLDGIPDTTRESSNVNALLNLFSTFSKKGFVHAASLKKGTTYCFKEAYAGLPMDAVHNHAIVTQTIKGGNFYWRKLGRYFLEIFSETSLHQQCMKSTKFPNQFKSVIMTLKQQEHEWTFEPFKIILNALVEVEPETEVSIIDLDTSSIAEVGCLLNGAKMVFALGANFLMAELASIFLSEEAKFISTSLAGGKNKTSEKMARGTLISRRPDISYVEWTLKDAESSATGEWTLKNLLTDSETMCPPFLPDKYPIKLTLSSPEAVKCYLRVTPTANASLPNGGSSQNLFSSASVEVQFWKPHNSEFFPTEAGKVEFHIHFHIYTPDGWREGPETVKTNLTSVKQEVPNELVNLLSSCGRKCDLRVNVVPWLTDGVRGASSPYIVCPTVFVPGVEN